VVIFGKGQRRLFRTEWIGYGTKRADQRSVLFNQVLRGPSFSVFPIFTISAVPSDPVGSLFSTCYRGRWTPVIRIPRVSLRCTRGYNICRRYAAGLVHEHYSRQRRLIKVCVSLFPCFISPSSPSSSRFPVSPSFLSFCFPFQSCTPFFGGEECNQYKPYFLKAILVEKSNFVYYRPRTNIQKRYSVGIGRMDRELENVEM
jgi:hypothetical protein